MPGDFDAAWRAAHPALRRSLELAYASLAAGGLPVGSVLTNAADRIEAEGRNRAYDPAGGPDALQRTPLAHAEMNVLAAVPTERELGDCTLWSTQEPCSMCAAAARFTGVGAVRYLAPDPSAAGPSADTAGWTVGPAEGVWLVTANVLFLHGIASKLGVTHPTVTRNHEVEPETAGIVADLVSEGQTADRLTRDRPLAEVLPALWPRIVAASSSRTRRLAPPHLDEPWQRR